jgi:hypothetical protein
MIKVEYLKMFMVLVIYLSWDCQSFLISQLLCSKHVEF